MDKTTYLLKNAYRLYGLPGRILSEDGRFLALPSESFQEEDPVYNSPELLRTLTGQENRPNAYRAYSDDAYWYYVFHDRERYVIWGPIAFGDHSRHEQLLYCQKRGARGAAVCSVPLMRIEKLEKTIAFLHGLLFEEYQNAITIDNGTDMERFREQLYARRSEYDLENAEYDKTHHSFAREQQMWKWLTGGNQSTPNQEPFQYRVGYPFSDVAEGMGLMAESQSKNLEYTAVSGITLITRYAIAAGVEENAAYALSDVALQTLAKATSAMEMQSILDFAFQEFSRLSREAGTERHSLYVEQTRDYIAKHILKKLSLQTVAKEVGLHPTYLSQLFSEQMKMTLTDYIMREKVQVSCNLLKYSDRPIAIIAEYIHLSPQSYFTRVFKKVTGETPAQYRRTHRDKNFLET